jgi:pyrophosphatase PpaX
MPSPAQQQAVLFDFDGTLGRSLKAWTLAYQDALRAIGVHRDEHAVRQACFSKRGIDVQREFQVADLAAFAEDVWSRVLVKMPEVSMYPDVEETLQSLGPASFKLGIVTNTRRAHLEAALTRWPVRELFHTRVTIDDVQQGKPDPEAIHAALESLDVSPSRAWMVGDSPPDIEAGNAAGVRTIAFSPEENQEYCSADTLRKFSPTHVARSFAEVRRLIFAED